MLRSLMMTLKVPTGIILFQPHEISPETFVYLSEITISAIHYYYVPIQNHEPGQHILFFSRDQRFKARAVVNK